MGMQGRGGREGIKDCGWGRRGWDRVRGPVFRRFRTGREAEPPEGGTTNGRTKWCDMLDRVTDAGQVFLQLRHSAFIRVHRVPRTWNSPGFGVSRIDREEVRGTIRVMRSLRHSLVLLGIFAGCLVQGGISSPVVMQLELTAIPGDSVDAKHPNTIDVLSFSFGVQMPSGSVIGGGGGTGKANFNNLVVTKLVDKTTPTLFLNCASGVRVARATLYVRPSNSTNDTYKLLLQDLTITGVTTSGAAAGERPTESVSFSFSKIQWFYQAFDANGAPSGASVVTGWDLVANKRL